ncbi:hypothetical protein PFISCL1PPCAC_4850, partial [Pristionchus fissidentatus]
LVPSIMKLVGSLGGLIFLAVVGFLFLCLFSAAPCVFCCYNCKRKKKKSKPPKFNPIFNYVGLGCSATAILFLFLSILFFMLSVESLIKGYKYTDDTIIDIPRMLSDVIKSITTPLTCGTADIMKEIRTMLSAFPDTVANMIVGGSSAVTNVNFDKMAKDFEEIENKVTDVKTKLSATSLPADPALTAAQNAISGISSAITTSNVKTKISDAKGEADKMKNIVDIKDKIAGVIKTPIDKANKGITDAEKSILDLTKTLDGLQETVSKKMQFLSKILHDNTKYVRLLRVSYIVLMPFIGLLVAAGFTVYSGALLVKKKTVKPKDSKCCGGPIMLPLNIAFGLAFLPVLLSIVFMFASGAASVTCGTIFDPEMEIVMRLFGAASDAAEGALATAAPAAAPPTGDDNSGQQRKRRDAGAPQEQEKPKFDIGKLLKGCRSSNNLMAAMGMNTSAATSKIEEQTQAADADTTFAQFDFKLPAATNWDAITTATNAIDTSTVEGLAALPNSPDFKDITAGLAEIVTLTKEFKEMCKKSVEDAKGLTNAKVRDKMSTDMTSLMTKTKKKVEENFKSMLTNAMSNVNCDFIFILFNGMEGLTCKQIVGGIHGMYAAAGLGVMCYFSAAIGGFLVWRSLLAGKGQDSSNGSDPKDSDKNKGKDKKKGKKGKK